LIWLCFFNGKSNSIILKFNMDAAQMKFRIELFERTIVKWFLSIHISYLYFSFTLFNVLIHINLNACCVIFILLSYVWEIVNYGSELFSSICLLQPILPVIVTLVKSEPIMSSENWINELISFSMFDPILPLKRNNDF
jgi:hypothetical protein